MRRQTLPFCFLLLVLLGPSLYASANSEVTLQGYAQTDVTMPAPQVAQPIGLQTQGVVGIDLDIYPQAPPVVRQVFPGTPAARAHFLPGDKLLAINGQETLGLNRTQVDVAISDQPGERITFLVLRQSRVLSISLTVADASTLANQSTRQLFHGLNPW